MADSLVFRAPWLDSAPPEEEASFREVPRGEALAPQSGPVSRARRVLLVDDDPLVLRSFARLLKLHRPTVSLALAENATVALEYLEASAFEVLITDLDMPGMRGEELLERALVLDPQLTCVVHSGQVLCLPGALRSRVRSALAKPASEVEVLATLDDALGRALHLRKGLEWLSQETDPSSNSATYPRSG